MKLMCMSFDGEHKIEAPEFETVERAWGHSNDIGSRWYFYPFHFVVTNSGKTIKDAPHMMEYLNGLRVKTVVRMFKAASDDEEAQGMDVDNYVFFLYNRYS